MKKLANIISVVFHPLWIPLYALLLYCWQCPLELAPMPLEFGLVAIFTIFVPMLAMMLQMRRSQTHDIMLSNRRDRFWPYIITYASYFLLCYSLVKIEAPFDVLTMSVYFLVAGGVVATINLVWKISAHLCGIGGLLGLALFLLWRYQINLPLLVTALVLLSGIVAWARLKLDAHTMAQVVAGWLLGVSVGVLFIFLYGN